MLFRRKQHAPTPAVGADVLTTDGECLGDVAAVHDDYLDVTGGTVDRRIRWRVPRSAISRIDQKTTHQIVTRLGEGPQPVASTSPQTIYLNVSCHQARVKGWDQPAGTSG